MVPLREPRGAVREMGGGGEVSPETCGETMQARTRGYLRVGLIHRYSSSTGVAGRLAIFFKTSVARDVFTPLV